MRDILSRLRQRNEQADDALAPIIDGFRQDVRLIEGEEFETFDAAQEVTLQIQQTADRFRVALACQKPGCGKPSKLRCTKSSRSTRGYFISFEHDEDGRRTKHEGKAKMPVLQIVPLPGPEAEKPAEPA